MKKIIIGLCSVIGALTVSADTIPAKNYIQKDLLFQLDGIENVALGQPHDSTSATWNDISGNGAQLTLNSRTSFETDGILIVSGNKAVSDTVNVPLPALDLHGAFTVESVQQLVQWVYTDNSKTFIRCCPRIWLHSVKRHSTGATDS